VFQDYLYGLEREETEYREEYSQETVEVTDNYNQLWLEGLGMKGQYAGTNIRRCDLPIDHPEYACNEQAELDWYKAKEVISKCWLEVFEEWIKDRAPSTKIKVHFKDVYSPKEYNFGGDECNFYLTIPKTEMNYIIRSCLVDDREGFKQYLKEAHSSYSGYWSFISNNIDDHMYEWSRFRGNADIDKGIEHLFWVCLDYWLFAYGDLETDMTQRFSENQDRFENDLWDEVLNVQGNGAFCEITKYTPVREAMEEVYV
jgi:hypothetical protein